MPPAAPQRRTIARMSSSDPPRQRGCVSEQLAAQYLQAQGLVILARNLRCKAGELDLVGLDGEVLAVVEVRQRSGARFGGACASVTRSKRRKIIRAAGFFWARRVIGAPASCASMCSPSMVRPTRAQRILWLKDAFRAT